MMSCDLTLLGSYFKTACSVNRLTLTPATPSKAFNPFSTLATQDAQVMPSTFKFNCFKVTGSDAS